MATAANNQKLAASIGKSCCEIVPSSDGHHFGVRVKYSPTKTLPVGVSAKVTTAVDGYTCEVKFWNLYGDKVRLGILVRRPALPEGPKVVTGVVLLDKARSPVSMASRTALNDLYRSSVGYCVTVARDVLEANCLVDDVLMAICSVYIVTENGTISLLPPPDTLTHRLAAMSELQELTDVSFDVDGETFIAHRLVLAARSPVFKAELYGQMAESRMALITIHDMAASTFRLMLHYMYHDELPDDVVDGAPAMAAELQHLLLAADRYGLDVLRQMCEDALCAGVTKQTVASTLELAKARSYPKLEARCLDFISDLENFRTVATMDNYYHLIRTFPSVMPEIRGDFERKAAKRAKLSPESSLLLQNATVNVTTTTTTPGPPPPGA